MRRRALLQGLCGGAAAVVVPGIVIAAPVRTDGLGQGPYSRLHVFLEKTILDIDVLSLEIRVDQATADALGKLVRGQKHSTELERKVVSAVLQTKSAYAGLKFLRDFSRDDFIEGVRAETRRAHEAKLVDRAEYKRVYDNMPKWFAFLGDRGIRAGDWLYNRGDPAGMRTVFVEEGGRQRMDVTVSGQAPIRTLLASYLAPGGDLRGPLVRSLFGKRSDAASSAE